MSEIINIGLDFGTHQTKVCIENSTDPRNITYSFLKFFEGTINETYFLPSIVQVNKNRTLLYGAYDYNIAKSFNKSINKGKKPKLVLPPEPKKEKLPNCPIFPEPLSYEEFVLKLVNKRFPSKNRVNDKQRKEIIDFVSSRSQTRINYNHYVKEENEKKVKKKRIWQYECNKVEFRNNEQFHKWEEECENIRNQYYKEIEKWTKQKNYITLYSIYRYFKIASFSKEYKWTFNVDPVKLSIWYITYVLFQIYKVVGEDSTVQLGIPQSISNVKNSMWQIEKAETIFYSAYRLYKFYYDEEIFLNATIDELDVNTNLCKLTEPNYPGLLVLPEAFASLITLTKEGKINRGITLLMDIGGGSTDISLFNIVEKRGECRPNISHILSIHKGLNHIFLLYMEDNENTTIEDVREIFQNNPASFFEYIDKFKKELAKDINEKIYLPLIDAASKCGITVNKLKDALYGRPVIYTGGGSVYDSFIDSMHMFTDPMSMSKDFISLKNITNKNLSDEELTILSVSYGLSVPQMKEPEMTPLSKLFDHIKFDDVNRNTTNYGMYEHGISDVE